VELLVELTCAIEVDSKLRQKCVSPTLDQKPLCVNLAAPGGIEARLFGRNLILAEKDVSKDEGGRMKAEG
jgi:hypothetical protein